MDPIANLAEIRRLTTTYVRGGVADGDVRAYADDLTEVVLALVEWIDKGGFPPRRESPPERT